jgi:PAS domain S-box-containing protein
MDLPELAREVLGSGTIREAQVRLPEEDRWFIVRLNPYRISAQPVSGVVATFVDVTEMRRAQHLAMENEAKYRNLFRNLVSGFAHCRMRYEGDWPADYQYLDVNDAFVVQRGIEDPTGRWITDLIPGIRERDDQVFQIYGRVARTGCPERHEIFVSAMGQWFDVTVYSPQPDEFIAVFDEITARKEAEAALAESEERYRSLFEASLAVLLVIDPADGAIVAANPAAAAFYGWPRPVLETMRVQDINLLPPDDVLSNLTMAAAQGQMAFAVKHRLADGRIRDVEVLASPIVIAGSKRNYAIIQDVTERKKAEDLVRESRAKLEAALASMADAVFISDTDGRFVEFNDAFASFHRFPTKEACARTFAEYPDLLDVFLPDGQKAPIEQWAVPRALRGETAVNQEYSLRRKDTGETWTASYNLAPLRDSAGTITGSVVTGRDITAQKSAERTLIESEQRFRTVFDNSPDAVLIRRPDGRFTDVNQVALDRYGYTREEFRQMTPEDLMPLRLAAQHRASAEQAAETGASTEWVNRKKDGTEFPVEVTLKAFTLNGETFICASVRDLSERKRAEAEKADLQEQLQQTQKMESLGRLAGGIAHDMNNVLGSIFAVAQLLKPICSADPNDTECLAVLERAAQRGRDLVRGLVGFARKERTAKVPVDLNDLIRKEVALLEHTLFQKYQLVVDLEETLPAIHGETGSLGSALMNLCVNAVDAMPDGGSLGIRTLRLGQDLVQIVVEDTGQGMPPEVVTRAMEPFYTTKPVGKGTGLGLSMAFNTAQAHGGTLVIHSEVGKGTQILMTLPISGTEPGLETVGDTPVPVRSALTILLVDDDELIRSTVPLMLRVLGHQVAAVDGGRAALDFLSRGTVPDLVVLDVNMPDMTGPETLKHIRSRFHDLPVLLATGYVDPGVVHLVEADPNALIIAKPFSFDEIQRKFSEVEALRLAPGARLPEIPASGPEDRPGPALSTASRASEETWARADRPAFRDPLAIVLIEDNAIDALMIKGLLKKSGLAFSLKHLQTRQELDAALQAGGIDLILSDYRLPDWDGLAALGRIRAYDPVLPFIFISGEVDEELFIEAIHRGANDFLFKDRLFRLVPCIEREMAARRALSDRPLPSSTPGTG